MRAREGGTQLVCMHDAVAAGVSWKMGLTNAVRQSLVVALCPIQEHATYKTWPKSNVH